MRLFGDLGKSAQSTESQLFDTDLWNDGQIGIFTPTTHWECAQGLSSCAPKPQLLNPDPLNCPPTPSLCSASAESQPRQEILGGLALAPAVLAGDGQLSREHSSKGWLCPGKQIPPWHWGLSSALLSLGFEQFWPFQNAAGLFLRDFCCCSFSSCLCLSNVETPMGRGWNSLNALYKSWIVLLPGWLRS